MDHRSWLVSQTAEWCEYRNWEEIGELFGAVLQKLVPETEPTGLRLREQPNTLSGLKKVIAAMTEGFPT